MIFNFKTMQRKYSHCFNLNDYFGYYCGIAVCLFSKILNSTLLIIYQEEMEQRLKHTEETYSWHCPVSYEIIPCLSMSADTTMSMTTPCSVILLSLEYISFIYSLLLSILGCFNQIRKDTPSHNV